MVVTTEPLQPAGKSGSEPIKLPLNPGSVPEAMQLSHVSDGLRKVREIVRRETLGAVDPISQLRAIDVVLQTHHDAIGSLVSTAFKQNAGALSGDDGVRLVNSLTEHMAMASYWLEVARPFPRVPAITGARRLLSEQRSRQRREGVLVTIAKNRDLALQLLEQLEMVAAAELPRGGVSPKDFLIHTRISIFCTEVHAVASAANAQGGNVVIPGEQLRHYRDELVSVRASNDFARMDDGQKSEVWICTAIIADLLGDTVMATESLQNALELSSRDLDPYIHNLLSSLARAESDEERLDLVLRLHGLATDQDLGPVFSRERLGRISILHDAFAEVSARVDQHAASAAALLQECFECRHRWTFDQDAPVDKRIIRITSGLQGSGRVAWLGAKGRRVTTFDLSPDLAVELITVTSSPSTSPRPIAAAINALSAELGPAIAEAFEDIPEARLDVAGVVGLLPVMATRVGSVPIGARANVSYLHPLTGAFESSDLPELPPDLLILDRSFGRASARVRDSFLGLHRADGARPTILEFDSEGTSSNDLDSKAAMDALTSATGAIFYGHCHPDLAHAATAALVLGRETELRIDAIAQLALRNLDSLILVACGSGQPNPFVGPISVAHAAAVAGARQLVFSLWPITAAHGARFTTGLLAALAAGGDCREYLAALHTTAPLDAAPFAIMRL